jgi:7-cyano-7-deazaguanine synthase
MRRAVVLFSGGLDSATIAANALAEGDEIVALSVNYGQKNVRELECAAKLVRTFGIRDHFTVDADLAQWCRTDVTRRDDAVVAGTAARESPPAASYVPGRNTVLIAIALSLAEAKKADTIYLGFNAADVLYPDTQASYLKAFDHFAPVFAGFNIKLPELVAPLIEKDKLGVVRLALELGVPIEETWSCFHAGETHCGCCGACRIRDFALIKAGRPDLATPEGRASYADGSDRAAHLFWRFALRDSSGSRLDSDANAVRTGERAVEASYDGTIFQKLNEVGAAYRLFRESGEKLEILGDIICRHGLHEVVGVPLLHRHFDLSPHERLVRRHHGSTFSSEPDASSAWSEFTPCLWRVERGSGAGQWSYVPLEFARTTGPGLAYQDRHAEIFSNQDFLLEMAEKIWELDVVDLFGIAMIPAGFRQRTEDEVLLEKQDLDRRINTAGRALTSNFGSTINIPSLWAFRP